MCSSENKNTNKFDEYRILTEKEGEYIMKKSIRNLMIGAAMTIGVFGASTAALAATQYVQNDMNFRNGPAVTAQAIGSVPAEIGRAHV